MIQSQFKVLVVAVTLAAIIIGILLIEQAQADETLPCTSSASGAPVLTAAGCLGRSTDDRDVRRDSGDETGRSRDAGGDDGGGSGGSGGSDDGKGPGKSNTKGGGKAKGKGGSDGHGEHGKGHE